MDSDITALILTKNEELHIERCINSIKDLVSNIYVIDSGKVIDSGVHKDLLSKSETYKSFYEKQIQK